MESKVDRMRNEPATLDSNRARGTGGREAHFRFTLYLKKNRLRWWWGPKKVHKVSKLQSFTDAIQCCNEDSSLPESQWSGKRCSEWFLRPFRDRFDSDAIAVRLLRRAGAWRPFGTCKLLHRHFQTWTSSFSWLPRVCFEYFYFPTMAAAPKNSFLLRNREKAEFNQYWYSPSTISVFVQDIQEHSGNGRVAFLSTPSIFFSLDSEEVKQNSVLFDVRWFSFFLQLSVSKIQTSCLFSQFDEGLARNAAGRFVKYDFNNLDTIPAEMHHTFDLAVIDPPFITEEVWIKYADAIKLLLKTSDSGQINVRLSASMYDFSSSWLASSDIGEYMEFCLWFFRARFWPLPSRRIVRSWIACLVCDPLSSSLQFHTWFISTMSTRTTSPLAWLSATRKFQNESARIFVFWHFILNLQYILWKWTSLMCLMLHNI